MGADTRYQRITVRLDRVQLAWVDAIAELHQCSRAGVIRESIHYFSAKEHARIVRTHRLNAIAAAIHAERWDPVGDYLAGRR